MSLQRVIIDPLEQEVFTNCQKLPACCKWETDTHFLFSFPMTFRRADGIHGASHIFLNWGENHEDAKQVAGIFTECARAARLPIFDNRQRKRVWGFSNPIRTTNIRWSLIGDKSPNDWEMYVEVQIKKNELDTTD